MFTIHNSGNSVTGEDILSTFVSGALLPLYPPTPLHPGGIRKTVSDEGQNLSQTE